MRLLLGLRAGSTTQQREGVPYLAPVEEALATAHGVPDAQPR